MLPSTFKQWWQHFWSIYFQASNWRFSNGTSGIKITSQGSSEKVNNTLNYKPDHVIPWFKFCQCLPMSIKTNCKFFVLDSPQMSVMWPMPPPLHFLPTFLTYCHTSFHPSNTPSGFVSASVPSAWNSISEVLGMLLPSTHSVWTLTSGFLPSPDCRTPQSLCLSSSYYLKLCSTFICAVICFPSLELLLCEYR